MLSSASTDSHIPFDRQITIIIQVNWYVCPTNHLANAPTRPLDSWLALVEFRMSPHLPLMTILLELEVRKARCGFIFKKSVIIWLSKLFFIFDRHIQVRLFKSPTSLDPLEYNPRYESCGSFSQGSLSGGKPIDKLVFHTTTSALVAACSGQSLAIWDLPGGSSAKPVNHFTTQAAFWDIQWSWDGDLLGGTTKAGQLSIWDPRATDSPVGEAIVHGVGGQKCSRLAWVGPHILTTGVNKVGIYQTFWAICVSRSWPNHPRLGSNNSPGHL